MGCIVFALPYCLVIFYYTSIYAGTSWSYWENSDAPNGLPGRYVIKSIMAFGILTILAWPQSRYCAANMSICSVRPTCIVRRMSAMEGIEV